VERTQQTSDCEPTAKELADYREFVAQARAAAGLKLKTSDQDRLVIAIDHTDPVVGTKLLMDAIGTNDPDFLRGLMSQLVAVNDDRGEPNDRRLNFMLSLIKGLEPRGQLGAMLAAHMAVVHLAIMQFAGRTIASDNIVHQEKAEGALNRLARTFTTQMECLNRYRASGPQTVQNVLVGEGGRAIVANMSQPPSETMPPKVVAPAPPTADTNVVPLRSKREETAERIPTPPQRRKRK
jgi:hypothetical protein